ncbi:hypothetical protein [Halobacteriovorax sp.]|uniref:hypothetical protein n=1 Tax=Halobacteriovorax sp. TaxID=2020862 RepID=UPI0035663A37
MTTHNTQQDHSEVAFQKLGNTWYVFTEVNAELIYSAMPEGMDPRETKLELYEIIEDHMDKVVQYYQKSKRNPEVAA